MKLIQSKECLGLCVWLGILFLSIQLSHGQTKTDYLSPAFGNHSVGFTHHVVYDSTRTYQRVGDWTNEFTPRPIPLSIWYPAEASGAPSLKVLDYMRVLAAEEEWEHLPDEQILNWFYYQNNERNRSHLGKSSQAIKEAKARKGQFPTIIYAPSLMASSVENFALCEYLASHGYIVIASPSRSDLSIRTNGEGAIERNIETQARDIEFVLGHALQMDQVNKDQIATMGFSLGGISDVVVKMKNKHIKAMVSLDGSIRYQYHRLKGLPFTNLGKMDVPFIHMAQKVIPDSIMKKYDMDEKLNTDFEFYDQLTGSRAFRLRFHDLTHAYFSNMGVLFHKRDPLQDKSDDKLIQSGKWVALYTLNFLNAFVKEDAEALKFIESQPEQVGVPEGLISKTDKQPTDESFNFRHFHDLVKKQGYGILMSLYKEVKAKNQSFEIPEYALNNLGLQLVFNPDKTAEGIRVFEFAAQLYPSSANLFDSLAEGYLFAGDKVKARENFEKSLELNSQNGNAIQRLKELKEE